MSDGIDEEAKEQTSVPIPLKAYNSSHLPVSKVINVIRCSLFAGMISARVTPECCMGVRVLSQRGLHMIGVARPCDATWACDSGGMLPTAMFQEKARVEACRNPKCMGAVRAPMR